MANLLALLVLTFACVIVNAQHQATNQQPVFGQTFDEIVVSSDLNVRRKSKESRQGKRLLSNVPSGTTGTPDKSTAFASRLISDDGTRVSLKKRETVIPRQRYLYMGVAGY